MEPVYFAPLKDNAAISEQVSAMKQLLSAARYEQLIAPHDFVAVKIHVGEKRNTTHVTPELVKTVVTESQKHSENVFLTETATLYKGERSNAVNHLLHAHKHGFGIERMGAPFIMADGLTGGTEVTVKIDGELDKAVKIAREIACADVLVAVTHATGHMMSGLGACIKNLGMGLASRAGKLRQHSSVHPRINPEKCTFCQKCFKWCPEDAIIASGQKAKILPEKCVGCAECFTVCRYDAIKYNWGVGSETLQKRMAEHAYGVVKDKKDRCFYINVLVSMTRDCDCMAVDQPKSIPDIGLLVSRDPVAIDKATFDLIGRVNEPGQVKKTFQNLNPLIQIEHAVKIGMGQLEYELVEVK
jgi:uncharacterized Fe-S center protein